MEDFIPCTLKQLPSDLAVEASRIAIDYNPTNRRSAGDLITFLQSFPLTRAGALHALLGQSEEDSLVIPPAHLAVLTGKKWGPSVNLTVGFPFESVPMDLQLRIVQHMNAWSPYGKVHFQLTATDPHVRITLSQEGYWSYLGTDILSIPRNQPTMCLQGFTMNTPESEFHRVVRHETGHTLGFPHEHMRQELVARLDVQKTLQYFLETQGWSAQTTRQQVLTPLSESSIRGTPTADQDSIMCYQLPGSITKDGQPIRGGVDIDPLDQAFIGKLYPLPSTPTPPPIDVLSIVLSGFGANDGGYTLTKKT